jgi:hypothetical protein
MLNLIVYIGMVSFYVVEERSVRNIENITVQSIKEG